MLNGLRNEKISISTPHAMLFQLIWKFNQVPIRIGVKRGVTFHEGIYFTVSPIYRNFTNSLTTFILLDLLHPMASTDGKLGLNRFEKTGLRFETNGNFVDYVLRNDLPSIWSPDIVTSNNLTAVEQNISQLFSMNLVLVEIRLTLRCTVEPFPSRVCAAIHNIKLYVKEKLPDIHNFHKT